MKNTSINTKKVHKIKFDDFSISYVVGGQKSRHLPVLFLHGWSMSTAPYDDCLNALAQRYWVIAPDLPGFGRSTCSRPLTNYHAYAHCLIQLIDKLHLSQFQLIGHSFGGGVALAIAAQIPQRVKKLIVINSTGIPAMPIRYVHRRWKEIPRQLPKLRFKPSFKILQAFLYNLTFQRQNLVKGARIALQEDIRTWVKKIESPCLVLWGERDYFTPLEIGSGLLNAIPHSQWQIVSQGYHEWCMMRPIKLAIIAFNFFQPLKNQTPINL